MWIPLRYNLRNLAVRRGTTLASAAGVALTVAVFVATMALVEGIRNTFVSTGSDANVLVMRKGAQSETASFVSADHARRIRCMPMRAGSSERIIYVNLTRAAGGSSNVVIRGLDATGRALQPQVRLTAGAWYAPGQRELAVSRSIAERFAGLQLGDTLTTGNIAWRVSGIFDGGPTAYGSEIWTDPDALGGAFRRFDYSVLLLQTESAAAAKSLAERIDAEAPLESHGWIERDYFAEQTKSSLPIRVVGDLVAVIMAVGSVFAGMNTMYAAVAHRQREIAVLRALGFSRRSVIASFIIEAALVSLLGGVLGVVASLPLNGIVTGTTNWFSFSEMTFALRVTPLLVARALAFATIIGVIGGVLPAINASLLSPREAMRAL